MNPAAGFTIDFNAFTPDASSSVAFTFFTIHDPSNKVVFDGGFMSPSTTSVFVPGGTLLASTAYTYELDFSDRISGFDSTTGVFTEEGFDVRTDGAFVTGLAVARVPEPATVALFGPVAAMALVLRRRRTAGR